MRKILISLLLVFPLITSASSGFVWKLFTLPSGLQFWSVQKVYANEKTFREVIEDYIDLYAPVYKVNPKIIKRVVECESNFNPEAVGDQGKAYGVAQFWQKTFDSFKKEAGIEDLEYKNWMHQIDLMFWAFSNGKQNHWTCK